MTEYITIQSKANKVKKQNIRLLYRITRLSDMVEWFGHSLWDLRSTTLIPYHVIKLATETPLEVSYDGKRYKIDHIRI